MPYKGGRRDKATLKYAPEVYTPDGAKTLSDRELRKEYSRLRSIARKRLERFEGTEWTSSQVYQQNTVLDIENAKMKPIYKPLTEMKNNRELRHLFSDLARFITAKNSSVRGLEEQRDAAIKTLNERGYEFVNKENFKKFGEFMEYNRIRNLNKIYDSKRVAEYFEWAEKKKLSNKELVTQFKQWMGHQKHQRKIQNKNPRNSAQYRSDLE